MSGTANEVLIENLEKQLSRLVEQLKDLEDCRCEISNEEYDFMKNETVVQIKEFESTLDRLQKGNVSLNNKLTMMKEEIRDAISKSFKTNEMIKILNYGNEEQQLNQLEEDFKMRKINKSEYEKKKMTILLELQLLGKPLTSENKEFIDSQNRENLLNKLEEIPDDCCA